MQILLACEYPLNVLKFVCFFMRLVRRGPSRAFTCNKKITSQGYLQGDLSDNGQAQLSSLFPPVQNKVNSNTCPAYL